MSGGNDHEEIWGWGVGLTKLTGNDSVRGRPRTETPRMGEVSCQRGDDPAGFSAQTSCRVGTAPQDKARGRARGACVQCGCGGSVTRREMCLRSHVSVTSRCQEGLSGKGAGEGYSPRAGLPSLGGRAPAGPSLWKGWLGWLGWGAVEPAPAQRVEAGAGLSSARGCHRPPDRCACKCCVLTAQRAHPRPPSARGDVSAAAGLSAAPSQLPEALQTGQGGQPLAVRLRSEQGLRPRPLGR